MEKKEKSARKNHFFTSKKKSSLQTDRSRCRFSSMSRHGKNHSTESRDTSTAASASTAESSSSSVASSASVPPVSAPANEPSATDSQPAATNPPAEVTSERATAPAAPAPPAPRDASVGKGTDGKAEKLVKVAESLRRIDHLTDADRMLIAKKLAETTINPDDILNAAVRPTEIGLILSNGAHPIFGR
jgi:hypothetical protein